MAWHCGSIGCKFHKSPNHRCANWRMAPIGGSVGKGGKNLKQDVLVIQGALNQVADALGESKEKLVTDGVAGAKTIAAIKKFQNTKFGNIVPDGRVDVNQKSFQELARAALGKLAQNVSSPKSAKVPVSDLRTPKADGQVIPYLLARGEKSIFSDSNLVIYINGIQTSGTAHAQTCDLLREAIKIKVIGVYNIQGWGIIVKLKEYLNQLQRIPLFPRDFKAALERLQKHADLNIPLFVEDFLQCLHDYASVLAGTVVDFMDSFARRLHPPGSLGDVLKFITMVGSSASEKLSLARKVLSLNAATLSLFNLIYSARSDGKTVHLVCHSQGNLISCNCLSALKWVVGGKGGKSGRVFVYSISSPCPRWPTADWLWHRDYANSADIVSWLSLGESFEDTDFTDVVDNSSGNPVVDALRHGLDPHDVKKLISSKNFLEDIKKNLGLLK